MSHLCRRDKITHTGNAMQSMRQMSRFCRNIFFNWVFEVAFFYYFLKSRSHDLWLA